MNIAEPQSIRKPARDYSSRNGHRIQAIILHHTGGKNSLGWLRGNSEGTSIHILIGKDGTTHRLVDDNMAAHHVGFSRVVLNGTLYSKNIKGRDANRPTLGIELENLGDGRDPYPEVQLRTAALWVAYWRSKYGDIPLLRHGDIDTMGKYDPKGVYAPDVLRFIEAAPTPAQGLVTGESTLVAPARCTAEQAVAYLAKRGVDRSYSPADLGIITNHYWTVGDQVGLDPLLAIAQMVHETGGLASWWSLRPRRNPAGIGVTGETSRDRVAPGPDWQMDLKSKMWRRGHAFSDWGVAAKAHMGHLLVYSVKPEDMTEVQRQIVLFDPRSDLVPRVYRGSAPRVADLDGHWAVPGVGYGEKIANIANEILRA